jgi:molybdate transport system regulatory protein
MRARSRPLPDARSSAPRLTIRIDLGGDAAFGPGKARLLELLDQKGSIRAAATAMKMSYRRAWLLIRDVEKTMGSPVITAATGGVHGGGATLTEFGRALLARYRTVEMKAANAAASELRRLARMATGYRGVKHRSLRTKARSIAK